MSLNNQFQIQHHMQYQIENENFIKVHEQIHSKICSIAYRQTYDRVLDCVLEQAEHIKQFFKN